jgi:hypothetical protein
MGWPDAPRSSCIHCPNHTAAEWRDVRARPVEWRQAVELDKSLRAGGDQAVFLHQDCVPLDEADLSDPNGVLFGHGCASGHCFT